MTSPIAIEVYNCNNIDKGAFSLYEGVLNVKYANNGTGKSTISKAIKAFSSGTPVEQNKLMPYKYIGKRDVPRPSVVNAERFKTVEIFNDEYVNRFLFQRDKTSKKEVLIPDSFTVFVKTPKYDENMRKISARLHSITEKLIENEKLKKVIEILETFRKNCGIGRSIAANSMVEKALNTGNDLVKIADEFHEYAHFLCNRENFANANWVGFVKKSEPFIGEDCSCPLCLSKDKQANLETVKKISQKYEEASLKELNNLLNNFMDIKEYLDANTQEFLETLSEDANGLDKTKRDRLAAIKGEVIEHLDRLKRLLSITPGAIDNVDELIQNVQDKRISLKGSFVNSPKMNEVVNEINDLLNKVYTEARQIKQDVEEQKRLIEETVEANKKNINAFLETAGYNYRVDIVRSNESANIVLIPSEAEGVVENVKDHLSYGERNAFAMVLFMYSAIQKKTDLIILDDPISSFDGNKKFALLNMMFLSDKKRDPGAFEGTRAMFDGLTVLMLTHDFATVVDVVHNVGAAFHGVKASFLTNKKGNLIEKEIRKDSFCSFYDIAMKKISASKNNVIKAIYLRRLKEYLGMSNSLEYHLLSNLLHRRLTPQIKNENAKMVDMTEEQIKSAEKSISSHIKCFVYRTEVEKVMDDALMKELYMSTESNYEKVQIFRVMLGGRKNETSNVLQKFANETCHIENDFIFQLDPTEFDTVPQYIVDNCDRFVESK